MTEEEYLYHFREYLGWYIRRMFNVELTEENLKKLFSYEDSTERNQYPLYFLWVLPEFTDWYRKHDKLHYMVLGENFTKRMAGTPWHDSHIVRSIHNLMTKQISTKYNDDLLIKEKQSLGWKLPHIKKGCQKFLWSFASKVERAEREQSAALHT